MSHKVDKIYCLSLYKRMSYTLRQDQINSHFVLLTKKGKHIMEQYRGIILF